MDRPTKLRPVPNYGNGTRKQAVLCRVANNKQWKGVSRRAYLEARDAGTQHNVGNETVRTTQMDNYQTMTDEQVLDALRSHGIWNQARIVFAEEYIKIGRAEGARHKRMTLKDYDRMQLEAVRRIAEVLGVTL